MLQRNLVELPLQYILERALIPSLPLLPEIPVPNWVNVRLPVDFHESESTYTITTDLPGVLRSEMKLYKEGDELVISGGRDVSPPRDESKDGFFHYIERRHSSFCRRIALPADAGEQITAVLNDGVLTVTIPRENRRGNRIFIDVA